MLNPDDRLPRLRFRLLPSTDYTNVGGYQHELERHNSTFEAIVAHPSSTPNKEEALQKVSVKLVLCVCMGLIELHAMLYICCIGLQCSLACCCLLMYSSGCQQALMQECLALQCCMLHTASDIA